VSDGLDVARAGASVVATNTLEDVRMPVSRRTLIAATAALSASPLMRSWAQGAGPLRIGVLTDLSGTGVVQTVSFPGNTGNQ